MIIILLEWYKYRYCVSKIGVIDFFKDSEIRWIKIFEYKRRFSLLLVNKYGTIRELTLCLYAKWYLPTTRKPGKKRQSRCLVCFMYRSPTNPPLDNLSNKLASKVDHITECGRSYYIWLEWTSYYNWNILILW